MLKYHEIIKFPILYKHYRYPSYIDPDGKRYNVDKFQEKILFVRDPHNPKYKLGEIVLVKTNGEYGEIVEVKQDLEHGNHKYDVEVFNYGFYLYCRDEYELEPLQEQ